MLLGVNLSRMEGIPHCRFLIRRVPEASLGILLGNTGAPGPESLGYITAVVLPILLSPPGSSVHGILQARILEWVVLPFSRGLPNPGIELRSPLFQVDSLPSEPPGKL